MAPRIASTTGPSARVPEETRLVDALVTALDPDGAINASIRRRVQRHYDALTAAVTANPWQSAAVASAYASLSGCPADFARQSAMSAAVRAAGPLPAGFDRLLGNIEAADTTTHHRGRLAGTGEPCPGTTTASELSGLLGGTGGGRAAEQAELAVVLSIRAVPEEPERLRNLIAALGSVRAQSLPRDRYRIIVVEQDEIPRCQELAAFVDEYRFAPNPGAYNKSWALNIGERTAGSASQLCFLDADALIDWTLLDRLRTALASRAALVPFSRVLYLDRRSTDVAIRRTLTTAGRDRAEPDLDHLRGFALRDVVGFCIAIRRELYQEIGGHDERFRGWGDEDNEFYRQLTEHTGGDVDRLPSPMVHLWHPRPRMLQPDGSRPNSALIGTPRPATTDWGRLDRYAHELPGSSQ